MSWGRCRLLSGLSEWKEGKEQLEFKGFISDRSVWPVQMSASRRRSRARCQMSFGLGLIPCSPRTSSFAFTSSPSIRLRELVWPWRGPRSPRFSPSTTASHPTSCPPTPYKAPAPTTTRKRQRPLSNSSSSSNAPQHESRTTRIPSCPEKIAMLHEGQSSLTLPFTIQQRRDRASLGQTLLAQEPLLLWPHATMSRAPHQQQPRPLLATISDTTLR